MFTDAMNMKGVIAKTPTGEAEVRALLAGNDVLEFSKNVPAGSGRRAGRRGQRPHRAGAHRRELAAACWPSSSGLVCGNINPSKSKI
ncbi:MAG: hypothetical protein WKG07_09955 [Hymenobacter sp.]